MTRLIGRLSDVAENYDALFCDLWGCLHDGVRALPEAVAAVRAFRARGGEVVLVSNSPRPHDAVARQIAGFGVPRDAWDTIATSGDAAREALFSGAVGDRIWFIGIEATLPFLETPEGAREVARVPLEKATGIVVTGPEDVHASPEVYREPFARAIARDLPLLSANPDIVVDRGDRREWCAGALAELYEDMGGRALSFGKPHDAIYDLARTRLGDPKARVLAAGDGIATDIEGARRQGIDALFITGGLAREDLQVDGRTDPDRLAAWLAEKGASPTYAIDVLR